MGLFRGRGSVSENCRFLNFLHILCISSWDLEEKCRRPSSINSHFSKWLTGANDEIRVSFPITHVLLNPRPLAIASVRRVDCNALVPCFKFMADGSPLVQMDVDGTKTVRYCLRHAIPSIASIAVRIDDVAQAGSA